MFGFRIRPRLRTFLAFVALFAVFLSVVSREAKRQRGWIMHGDVLIVEVLEGLPGDPITGNRRVRSDGTIDLGYYGQLRAANLNLTEFKISLVHHLRRRLSAEILGLTVAGDNDDPAIENQRIDPADSDRVFVDLDDSGWTKSEPMCSEYFLDKVNLFMGYKLPSPRRYAGPCCPFSPSPIPAPPSFMAQAIMRLNNGWDWVVSSLSWSIRNLTILLGLCFLSTLERRNSDWAIGESIRLG